MQHFLIFFCFFSPTPHIPPTNAKSSAFSVLSSECVRRVYPLFHILLPVLLQWEGEVEQLISHPRGLCPEAAWPTTQKTYNGHQQQKQKTQLAVSNCSNLSVNQLRHSTNVCKKKTKNTSTRCCIINSVSCWASRLACRDLGPALWENIAGVRWPGQWLTKQLA